MADDKTVLIKTAYSYYQKGDWTRAIEEYHKLADIDPKDLNVHNMLADIYAKKGDAPEALQQYDLVAQGYDQKNQVDKVLQVYKRMLKLVPNDAQLTHAVKNLIDKYLSRAAQMEEEDLGKAGDIYHSILKVEPDRVDVNVQYAKLLMKKNEKFEAIEVLMNLASILDPATQTGKLVEVLQWVTEWDPLHIPAREKLIDLLIEARKTEAAVKSLRDLIEIYISKSDFPKAEEAALKAIQLGDQETQYHLGVIYFNLQKYSEARAAFENFLTHQESHVGALKYLALSYLRLSQPPGAIKVYLKILDVYFNENLLDEAREVRQTILELDPNNSGVKKYALDQSSPEPAVESQAAEVSVPPGGGAPMEENQQQALLIQAQAFAEKGLYEQAIDTYLDMLKRWPQLPDIRVRLQQVYALMARSTEPAQSSPEQMKAELERELRAQMSRELEEQARRLSAEQTKMVQERQRELDLKREQEQVRFKKELEETKGDIERRIREQIEKEMREKLEKDSQRKSQIEDAIHQEDLERRQHELQKKEQAAAKDKVNKEIFSGMERLRLEKQKESKMAAGAAAHSPKPAEETVGNSVDMGTPKESLEDPLVRQALADMYANQSMYMEALKIYERILSEDPNNEDVKQKLRNILRIKGM